MRLNAVGQCSIPFRCYCRGRNRENAFSFVCIVGNALVGGNRCRKVTMMDEHVGEVGEKPRSTLTTMLIECRVCLAGQKMLG